LDYLDKILSWAGERIPIESPRMTSNSRENQGSPGKAEPLSKLLCQTADSWGLSNGGKTPHADPGAYVVDDLRSKGLDLKGKMPSDFMKEGGGIVAAKNDRRGEKTVKLTRTKQGVFGGMSDGGGNKRELRDHEQHFVDRVFCYFSKGYGGGTEASFVYPCIMVAFCWRLVLGRGTAVVFGIIYFAACLAKGTGFALGPGLKGDELVVASTVISNYVFGFSLLLKCGLGLVQSTLLTPALEAFVLRVAWREAHTRVKKYMEEKEEKKDE
jgi:hypothetical protein